MTGFRSRQCKKNKSRKITSFCINNLFTHWYGNTNYIRSWTPSPSYITHVYSFSFNTLFIVLLWIIYFQKGLARFTQHTSINTNCDRNNMTWFIHSQATVYISYNYFSTVVEGHPQSTTLDLFLWPFFCWVLLNYSFSSSLASLQPTAMHWHLFFQVELVWMGFECEKSAWDKQKGLNIRCMRQYN